MYSECCVFDIISVSYILMKALTCRCMRIDWRKGLNEVNQQGSHSSRQDIYSSDLVNHVYNENLQKVNAPCCNLNLTFLNFEWAIMCP